MGRDGVRMVTVGWFMHFLEMWDAITGKLITR